MKSKVKRSPRRNSLWLIAGIVFGLSLVAIVFVAAFEPRRDMAFIESARIVRDDYIAYTEYSADESRILLQTSGASLSSWDTEGNIIQDTFVANVRGFHFDWNPQGTHFAKMLPDAVLIFDKDGNVSAQLEQAQLSNYAWSPAGDRLYTVSQQQLTLWRPDGSEINRIQIAPDNYLNYLVWSPDGQFFVSNASKGAAIWNADGQVIKELPIEAEFETVINILWSDDSSRIVIDRYTPNQQRGQFQMQLLDTKGNLLWEYQHDNQAPNAIIWSPDSAHFAFVSYNGENPLLDLFSRDGEQKLSLEHYTYLIWQAQGQSFLAKPYLNCPTSCKEDWLLYDTEGNILQRIASDAYYDENIWSPDGEYFLTWTSSPVDGYFSLFIWDKNGNQIGEMLQSTSIQNVVWSEDSYHFVSYGGFIASVWTVDREKLATLRHSQPITEAEWSADATRIRTMASYAASGAIETAVWKLDGTHLATLYTGNNFYNYLVTMSSDFTQALVASGNHLEILDLQAGSIWFDFRWD